MAKFKIEISSELYDALKSTNLENSHEGVTNFLELIEGSTNVGLIRSRTVVKTGCTARNTTEKRSESIILSINAEVWGEMTQHVLDTFTTSRESQLISLMLINDSIIDFSFFDLVPEYAETERGGLIPTLNLIPSLTKNFFELKGVGLKNGFSKNTIIGGAPGSLKLNFNSNVFDSKIISTSLRDSSSKLTTVNTTINNGLVDIILPPNELTGVGNLIIDSFIFAEKASYSFLLIDFDLVYNSGFAISFPTKY